MKAAAYTRYGPPSVVQIKEVERPVPKDNEVLVRVHATTVCAGDWRGRKADHPMVRVFNGLLRPRKPMIGGAEFSGRVVEAGANVKRFKVGDLIFGSAGMGGAHAEYICVPELSWTAKIPETVSLDDAAAMFFGGCTCLVFFKPASIGRGKNVLVYGASGAVGVAAVQIARHLGARVTGVCGPNNLDLVKSLGADAVVDYTREDYSKAGRVYDVIVDTVGKSGFGRGMKVLKRGGAYLLINGPLVPGPGRLWAGLTGAVKVVGPFPIKLPEAADIVTLWKLASTGALKAVIGKRFSFDRIADAHAYAETGHKVGNALVVIGGEDA